MNNIVLQLDPVPGNARNSEGAFVTLKDGRILFAWSKFLSDQGGDHEPSIIVCRTSDDGGQSWTNEDRVLVKPEGNAHNVMSVSLLRLQDGRIALLYLSKTNKADGAHECRPEIRFSDDEMATLSPATALTLSADYHVGNNDRLIQLDDGTLILPVAQHRFGIAPQLNAGKAQLQFKAPGLIFCFLSRDGGRTWTESTNSFYRAFPDGSGLQEPGVLPLQGGRLWLWARTAWKNGEAHARQWQAFSADNGSTWSEPEPSVFASPCSPLSMKRIPPGSSHGGDLLAVWNDHSGRFPFSQAADFHNRSPLACAVSADDGATWKHHRLLENEPGCGYCYTAIHFTDDAVLLAYCAGGPKPQNCLQRLRVRRILLSELSR
jgi:Neuraminidase (sialidase)